MRKKETSIDRATNGGKLRAEREAANLSLRDIQEQSGYDTGYLSRIERNFFGVSSAIFAAYEQAVGHPIEDVTIDAQSIQEVQEKARQRLHMRKTNTSPSRQQIDREQQISAVRGAIIGSLAGGHLEGPDGASYSKGVLLQIADLLGLEIPESIKDGTWRQHLRYVMSEGMKKEKEHRHV